MSADLVIYVLTVIVFVVTIVGAVVKVSVRLSAAEALGRHTNDSMIRVEAKLDRVIEREIERSDK